MRRGILILGALGLLLALGLATQPAARAGAPAQAGPTPTGATQGTPAGGSGTGAGSSGALGTPYAPPNPPGGPGNGAPAGPGAGGSAGSTGPSGGGASQAPDNLPGQGPNLAVGYFLPVCLILGILVAGISALVATRRDLAKAKRIRGRDAPDVR